MPKFQLMCHSILIRLTTLLSICLFPIAALLGQEQSGPRPRVHIDYTALSLERPKGFRKAGSYRGFEHKDLRASVMVLVIPGPYAEVTKGYETATLDENRMRLLSKSEMRICDSDGMLIKPSQSSLGTEYTKWITVFGDENETKIVMATFPTSESQEFDVPMRSTVLSIQHSDAKDSTDELPFRVGQVTGLERVASVAGMGMMTGFTRDGRLPAATPQDPVFAITNWSILVSSEERKSFVLQRLKTLEDVIVEEHKEPIAVEIDGMEGWEIHAIGRDKESDTPLAIYQVMLYPNGVGYVRMVGLVGRDLAADYIPKFKSLARSYEMIPDSDD
ncbi:MAG: hypothetical protein AAGD07_21710 [Planctomycetota bacterium]